MSAAPLRVGFDATAAAEPRPTGVGLSLAHLVRALRELTPAAGLELEVCYRLSRLRRRAHFLPGPARLFHERWSVLLARRLAVWHGADSRLPRFAGPALVATVHDLSARREGFSTPRFRATRERHWAAVAARADLVVTYTRAVRAEVARELGLAPERVAVVPLAPSEALAPPDAEAVRRAAREHLGERPYVLCLGELSRRKNTVGAVTAFAAAGAALGETALALVGPPGHGAEEALEAAERLGVAGRVRWLRYLPASEVAALLAGARALLFPTRYEGFGMPVLEAFRAGVPVVASDAASVVEVAGGAAVHAAPDDADALGRALVAVLEDPARAAELVARGRARLAAFTWERSAERLVAVYRAAAAGGPAPAFEAAPRAASS